MSELRFPITRWSIIARLKSSDALEAQNAVQDVFTIYRYPLYGYLRSSSLGHEDAEDVLQGFFAKMMRNDALSLADPERGRLRTFLLTSLSRFKLNFLRGEQRRHLRVQGEGDLLDEDEARWQSEQHATHETPETYYERRWALELINRVRQRLSDQYEKRGKQTLHAALAPLLSSTLPETESFVEITSRLGVTDNALRVSLSRMRGDFRDLLLAEVKLTLDDSEDVKTEIRYLLGLFES